MCCCIPHEHVESQRGRYKDFNGKNLFRVTMLGIIYYYLSLKFI